MVFSCWCSVSKSGSELVMEKSKKVIINHPLPSLPTPVAPVPSTFDVFTFSHYQCFSTRCNGKVLCLNKIQLFSISFFLLLLLLHRRRHWTMSNTLDETSTASCRFYHAIRQGNDFFSPPSLPVRDSSCIIRNSLPILPPSRTISFT